MIYVISNVPYDRETRLNVDPTDLLVFLNKAASISYYPEHQRKICIHRSNAKEYGERISGIPNFFIYTGPSHMTPPKGLLDAINKEYDWNYEVEKGSIKSPTTGYLAIKCLEKKYPKEEIVLVNFGYRIRKSSYRCPWHNWKFEDTALAKYKHIYTAPTIDGELNIEVVYCCDANYADMAKISAASVLKHNPNAHITVVSDVPLNLPEKMTNIVYKLDKINPFVTDRLSKAAYLRLFLPEILKDKGKVIYLDCDTLCKGSLDELWLTSVPYIGATHSHNTGIKQAKELHINTYYLSSMLLLNLNGLRRLAFSNICAFSMEHMLLSPSIKQVCDEGIINSLFNQYIQELPIQWNYCINRSYTAYPRQTVDLNDAVIVHYIGNQKQQMLKDAERATDAK